MLKSCKDLFKPYKFDINIQIITVHFLFSSLTRFYRDCGEKIAEILFSPMNIGKGLKLDFQFLHWRYLSKKVQFNFGYSIDNSNDDSVRY